MLLVSGAASLFLASNAFQAGSLAASQPGLTIVDPLVASMLGVVLFGERLNHHPVALVGEVLAAAVLVVSVIALSRSPLVQEENGSVTAGREKREFSEGPPSITARHRTSAFPNDDVRI